MGASDKMLHVHDVRVGKSVLRMGAHSQRIRGLSLLDSGVKGVARYFFPSILCTEYPHIVTACSDGTVNVWDASSPHHSAMTTQLPGRLTCIIAYSLHEK